MSDHDEINHQRADDGQLTLGKFAQLQSASIWEELCSIRIGTDYPFMRSDCDLGNRRIATPSELPFANPEAANAALRKSELERLVWTKICAAVDDGNWQCSGRQEDELDWRSIPAKILPRAVPNFSAGSIALLGDIYADIEFQRTRPEGAEEKALRIIRKYCGAHDPRAHTVADVVGAIEREGQLRMSDGRVRKLMHMAGVSEGWHSQGRRVARCAACKL